MRLQVTYEIAGVALGLLSDEILAIAKKDINKFLETGINLRADGLKVSLAENSDKRMNLCLPYYSWIKSSPGSVGDGDMTASGGEFRDNLWRLPPTTDEFLITTRNLNQVAHNAAMAFTGQYSRIDNSYDGDFDAQSNPTYLYNK